MEGKKEQEENRYERWAKGTQEQKREKEKLKRKNLSVTLHFKIWHGWWGVLPPFLLFFPLLLVTNYDLWGVLPLPIPISSPPPFTSTSNEHKKTYKLKNVCGSLLPSVS